jgi:hypothetical protein
MKKILLFLLLSVAVMEVRAQVNLDDELIPSQGGVNDNPVRHKVYGPSLQNRVVFQKSTAPSARLVAKRKKQLKAQQAQALQQLNEKIKSEGGHLIDCDQCLGVGIENCASCQGHGVKECAVCHGATDQKCKRCEGAGMTFDQKCTACEGTGINVCKSCGNQPPTCHTCLALGYLACTKCSGAGKIVSR